MTAPIRLLLGAAAIIALAACDREAETPAPEQPPAAQDTAETGQDAADAGAGAGVGRVLSGFGGVLRGWRLFRRGRFRLAVTGGEGDDGGGAKQQSDWGGHVSLPVIENS